MKLKNISIENVKSFKYKETINFNNDFNILIGPNAGGKSNLLDIITIIIHHFFLKEFDRGEKTQDNDGNLIETITEFAGYKNINISLDKYIGENKPSKIEIIFKITKEDIENINIILTNKEKILNEFNFKPDILQKITDWKPMSLKDGIEVKYEIINNKLENISSQEQRDFLKYLNNFNFFVLLGNDINMKLNPIYLYFPPIRSITDADLRVDLSKMDIGSRINQYVVSNSKSTSSIIRLAIYYFAMKRRIYEHLSFTNGNQEIITKDKEIETVSDFLKRVGYDWEIKSPDLHKNVYEITLLNNGVEFKMVHASSGEKEFLNFLLTILGFNIKNGLIIIDEPELHLHPKWQSILMELFIKLCEITGNQFVISTHSPMFINERTISNVIRIYKDDQKSSRKVEVKEDDLPTIRNLLHIVNSYNNEKLFFADKIVLVEGLSDRLLFQNLIRIYQPFSNNSQIIEVIEVGGKQNFKKYEDFLKLIELDCSIISDLDYASDIGDEGIKGLFTPYLSKISKDIIKNKKSKDGRTLANYVEDAIKLNKITSDLKDLWTYINNRHRKLRDDLTSEEKTKWQEFLNYCRQNQIFILNRGEIENYLPDGYKDLDGIIELTKEDNFCKWLLKEIRENSQEFVELRGIMNDIFGADRLEDLGLDELYEKAKDLKVRRLRQGWKKETYIKKIREIRINQQY